jgi:hypothetical protein
VQPAGAAVVSSALVKLSVSAWRRGRARRGGLAARGCRPVARQLVDLRVEHRLGLVEGRVAHALGARALLLAARQRGDAEAEAHHHHEQQDGGDHGHAALVAHARAHAAVTAWATDADMPVGSLAVSWKQYVVPPVSPAWLSAGWPEPMTVVVPLHSVPPAVGDPVL